MQYKKQLANYIGGIRMKDRILVALAFAMVSLSLYSQVTDDMYFIPTKKNAEKNSERSSVVRSAERTFSERDVDEYNRRGTQERVQARLVGDTLYVTTSDSTQQSYTLKYDSNGDVVEESVTKQDNDNKEKYYSDNYYEDDFYYTARLTRFRGYHYYDPFIWDVCYGWYDPWYDPWYGWYAPYYRYGYYNWYHWGWGWHCSPGWDLCWGHHGYYRDHIRPGSYMPARNGGQREASVNSGRRYGTSVASRGNRVGSNRMGTTGRSVASDYTRGTRRSTVADVRSSGRGTTIEGGSRVSRNSSGRTVTTTPSRSSSSRSSYSSGTSSRSSSSMSSGSFGSGSRGGGFSGGFSGGSRGGGRGGR